MLLVNEATVEEREPVKQVCTLLKESVVEKGSREDWNHLAIYHYRSHHLAGVRAIYRARHIPTGIVAGVIVYVAPSLNNMTRNAVLGDLYLPGSTIGKGFMAHKLNAEVDLISRVVVHPVMRGVGFGAHLIRQTPALRGKLFIEASSTMGNINPFNERGG